MMKFFYFAPLALFLFIAIYFANGLSRDAGYMPSMLIDQPVPEFDLPPILGRDAGLSSADLKGEVVMVNVFGSWCVGCKIEHPQLLAIASEGIVPIHGLDWKDKPGTGAAWLADHGDPYQRVGDDRDGRVAIDFGVTGAPETFIIDRDGRVRHKHVGPIREVHWRTVLKPMIEDLKSAPSDQ